MILISKAERDLITKKFPRVYIMRTCVQKSNRHRYYCKEDYKVMKFLDELRGNDEASSRRYKNGERFIID